MPDMPWHGSCWMSILPQALPDRQQCMLITLARDPLIRGRRVGQMQAWQQVNCVNASPVYEPWRGSGWWLSITNSASSSGKSFKLLLRLCIWRPLRPGTPTGSPGRPPPPAVTSPDMLLLPCPSGLLLRLWRPLKGADTATPTKEEARTPPAAPAQAACPLKA